MVYYFIIWESSLPPNLFLNYFQLGLAPNVFLSSYLGPEFQCKPGSGDVGQYDINMSGSEMMQLLGTLETTPRYCSIKCFMDPRCHGFKSLGDNLCTLYDYYPFPIDSMVVGEYYQLYCI